MRQSLWSGPRRIETAPYIITAGGRKLTRHSSEKGSVLEINDAGKKSRIFIADALYRASVPWAKWADEAGGLPYNKNFSSTWIMPGIKSCFLAASITDEELNDRFAGKWDTNTSKQSTEILCAVGKPGDYSYHLAAWYCKDISIDGIGELALPNVQVLTRVFCEAVAIDAIDPTAQVYRNYALTKLWEPKVSDDSPYLRVWTSSHFNSSNAICVRNDACFSADGKTRAQATVPVAELS